MVQASYTRGVGIWQCWGCSATCCVIQCLFLSQVLVQPDGEEETQVVQGEQGQHAVDAWHAALQVGFVLGYWHGCGVQQVCAHIVVYTIQELLMAVVGASMMGSISSCHQGEGGVALYSAHKATCDVCTCHLKTHSVVSHSMTDVVEVRRARCRRWVTQLFHHIMPLRIHTTGPWRLAHHPHTLVPNYHHNMSPAQPNHLSVPSSHHHHGDQ